MKAYKLLRTWHDGGRTWLISYCMYPVVYYRVGQWTKRPQGCGPLACFLTLGDALESRIESQETVIYQCEIVPSSDKYLWVERQRLTKYLLPAGTILADRVRLIERIEWEHTK